MSIYNLGIIIKELRKKKNFSQKQLAEGICSVEYISMIEHNKKTPSPSITTKLMLRLGTDPDMFFSRLNYIDNQAHQLHCFELDSLINQSHFEEARAYIHELEKNYPFYASGEPRQYIMVINSHILTNLDKKYDEAYELAYKAIQITKPDFSVENMQFYEFYSLNELWALLYMSAALYWKQQDLEPQASSQEYIALGEFVFTQLERDYLQPSLIGPLYLSACFYLSKYFISSQPDKSMELTDKGIRFAVSRYNRIIELLGKIYCNKSYLTYRNGWHNESKRLADRGASLIKLADNQTTIDRYLGKLTFQEVTRQWNKDGEAETPS